MINDKLKLMCGLPIPIGDTEIKPYTLKEIAEIGYTDYMSILGMLFLDTDYFLKELRGESFFMEIYEKKHLLTPFDFYMMLANNGGFGESLKHSLSLVFRVSEDDIHIDNENSVIFITSNEDVKLIIDKDVFARIVDVLKYQNGLKGFSKEESDEFNPADEKAQALIEKMKANRSKVEKIKSEEDEDGDLDIFDIVSAITARSNSLNKIDVLNLTIFQIYDELSRLQMVDAYENYIKASMAGAKLDGEIPHWSNKI